MMDLSIPYYEDFTRISNSNIGWFLNKGPAFLHKMLSGKGEEEKSAALTKGTIYMSIFYSQKNSKKTM